MKKIQLTSFSGKPRQRRGFPAKINTSYLLNPTTNYLQLQFESPLNIDAIEISSLQSRRDELWHHTCFECFILYEDKTYEEWNFDQTGNWQCYQFNSYRSTSPPLPAKVEEKSIGININLKSVSLQLPTTKKVIAINPCIILEREGIHEFYAYLHPDKKADFHDHAYFIHL